MKSQRVELTLFLVVSLATVSGCGKAKTSSTPEGLTPVEGAVTLDNKPLANVVVTFCSEIKGNPNAAGVTNEKGQFRLTSFPSGDGAKPGKYKVIVVKRTLGGYAPRQDNSSIVRLPNEYGIPEQTPLAIDVPSKDTIVLKLKSKP